MNKIELNWSKETKKKLLFIALSLLILLLIGLFAFYLGNEEFKTFFDRYIWKREIQENNSISIPIDIEENPSIYAYDRYITVLNKNKLDTYSNSGKKEFEHEVLISDAIYSSNNRFLAIAQKNGKALYLISGPNILWQSELEGTITKINVNKNGYISVIVTENGYKAEIITYNPEGKRLFTTYLSSTIAIDTDISNDNKYLSIAEINTSGTLIQSNIRTISIEKAQSEKEANNSVVSTYNAEPNNLITNIKYQDRNRLICMYDNGIHCLLNESDENLILFEENKRILSSIEFNNYAMAAIERTNGLFNTETEIILKNTQTQKENIYTVKGAVKNIQTIAENIVINLGSEAHFISTNGWLIKKYLSEQEIKNIVLADKIAGIVYKDKIEIINL